MRQLGRTYRRIRLCMRRKLRKPVAKLRLRRRLIPFGVALLAAVIGVFPVSAHMVGEMRVNQYTALYVAIIYCFQSVLFYYMRRRMRQDGRRLTNFGYALIDFFTGLTLLSFVFFAVYTTVFISAVRSVDQPFWLRMINRSSVGMAGTLIVGTGIAVGIEMRRARGRLLVHEDSDQVEALPRYRPPRVEERRFDLD